MHVDGTQTNLKTASRVPGKYTNYSKDEWKTLVTEKQTERQTQAKKHTKKQTKKTDQQTVNRKMARKKTDKGKVIL